MATSSRDLKIRYIGDDSSLRKTVRGIDAAHASLGTKLKSIGSKVAGVGTTMTKNFTLPIAAGFGFAFKSASDLNESMSKVGVVFGKSAGQIKSWSSTSATALGMSQQQALEAAGTYGNLFRAMDIGMGPTTRMSKGLVNLSADLASFNNMDPTQVLDALRSGLAGETEPLKRLGVNLSAVRIEQQAVNMGLAKNGQELTAAAKAQATYALIMQDTKLAQGDFARTSDGAANKLRIMKAQALDAAAGIGNVLLPIGTKLLGWVQGLISGFATLSPGTQKVIVMIAAAAAAIGPLLIVVGKLTTAIGAILPVAKAVFAFLGANPWMLLIAATVLLVVVIVKNWDKIKAFLFKVWNAIKGAAMAVWRAISAVIKAVLGAIWKVIQLYVKLYVGVWRIIVAAARGAWNGVKAAAGAVWSWIGDKARAVKDVLVNVWNAVRDGAKRAWDGIVGIVQSAINGVIRAYNGLDVSIGPWSIPSWVPVVGGNSFHIPDLFPDVGYMARGGRSLYGGLTVVGERGPELMNVPAGATVMPNNRWSDFAGGGSGALVVNVIVHGSVVSERELVESVRRELLKVKRRSGDLGLA